MKQVIEAFKRTDAEKRIPVLKMEIDYELSILYEALKDHNPKQIKKSKERLEEMRKELILLEA